MQQIETGDLEVLRKREKETLKRLEDGRARIEGTFQNVIDKMHRDFEALVREMREASSRAKRPKVNQEQRTELYEEHYRVNFNLFDLSTWFNRDRTRVSTRTVTYRYANTYDAIDQVEAFADDTKHQLEKRLRVIVDPSSLRKEIKEGARALFDRNDVHFDPRDILEHVDRATNQLKIPEPDLGNRGYAERILGAFGSGRVEEGNLQHLEEAQREAITMILEDLGKAVEKETQAIARQLEEIRLGFYNGIIKSVQDDLTRLQEALQDKTRSLQRHSELLSELLSVLEEKAPC
jgi:hypothetical protein